MVAGRVGADQITCTDTTVQNLDIDVLFIPLLSVVLLPFELALDRVPIWLIKNQMLRREQSGGTCLGQPSLQTAGDGQIL